MTIHKHADHKHFIYSHGCLKSRGLTFKQSTKNMIIIRFKLNIQHKIGPHNGIMHYLAV